MVYANPAKLCPSCGRETLVMENGELEDDEPAKCRSRGCEYEASPYCFRKSHRAPCRNCGDRIPILHMHIHHRNCVDRELEISSL